MQAHAIPLQDMLFQQNSRLMADVLSSEQSGRKMAGQMRVRRKIIAARVSMHKGKAVQYWNWMQSPSRGMLTISRLSHAAETHVVMGQLIDKGKKIMLRC